MITLQTAESVTEGHPDKIADQISDTILDAFLEKDPNSRVACEVLTTTGLVMIAGEVTSDVYVDLQAVTRKTIHEIGYTKSQYHFDAEACAIISTIHEQSPDIAQGVVTGGAGDQGIMIGYACQETEELMPLPISLAHSLTHQLAAIRKSNQLDYLGPDGKAQVTVEYHNNQPKRIATVVVSAQHNPHLDQRQLKSDLLKLVIKKSLPGHLLDDKTAYFINPTGSFSVGGPHGDTGLTGRKISIDSYGSRVPHGGGAFSGKDPTKVDRSGAYMARYLAKNIVAAGLAEACQVQLAYAIGVAEPVAISIDTFQTGPVSDPEIVTQIKKTVGLTPTEIINRFQLCQPIYRQTASYGHFGRADLDLPWERLDLKSDFSKLLK